MFHHRHLKLGRTDKIGFMQQIHTGLIQIPANQARLYISLEGTIILNILTFLAMHLMWRS